jgi:hypothetical protein
MPYTRYTAEQKDYLKQNYHRLSNAELAAALGIETPRKAYGLARRLGIKWRAENGAPRWREPKPDAPPKQSIWLR